MDETYIMAFLKKKLSIKAEMLLLREYGPTFYWFCWRHNWATDRIILEDPLKRPLQFISHPSIDLLIHLCIYLVKIHSSGVAGHMGAERRALPWTAKPSWAQRTFVG